MASPLQQALPQKLVARQSNDRQASDRRGGSSDEAARLFARPLSAELFSDEALMALMKCGFAPAWDELYARYRAPISDFLNKKLDSHACEDALQETFIRVSCRAHTFNGGAFLPWLFTIAHHQVCDEFRRRSRRRERSSEAYEATTGRRCDSDDRHVVPPVRWVGRDRPCVTGAAIADRATNDLFCAFAGLAEVEQLSIFLAGFGEFTLLEIAESIQVRPGTIGVRLHRFRARSRELRRRLLADEERPADGEELRIALLEQWRRLRQTPCARRTQRRARRLGLAGKWLQIEKRLADRAFWVEELATSSRSSRRRKGA